MKLGAVVLLVMVSAPAAAQPCGWILWHQIETERATVWKAMDGHPTIAECRADRDVMEKREATRRKQTEKEEPSLYWVNRYSCFPSDFDPREKTR